MSVLNLTIAQNMFKTYYSGESDKAELFEKTDNRKISLQILKVTYAISDHKLCMSHKQSQGLIPLKSCCKIQS